MRQIPYGFHLIELLISLAIIAILVQLAVPQFTQPLEKTNQVNALSKLLEAQTVLELCYSHQHDYAACARTLNDVSIETGTGAYLIVYMSDNPSCTRWQVNHQNETRVFDKDGILNGKCLQ